MVYSGGGISYNELAGMDLSDFREAVEAKRIYVEMVREAGEKQ